MIPMRRNANVNSSWTPKDNSAKDLLHPIAPLISSVSMAYLAVEQVNFGRLSVYKQGLYGLIRTTYSSLP